MLLKFMKYFTFYRVQVRDLLLRYKRCSLCTHVARRVDQSLVRWTLDRPLGEVSLGLRCQMLCTAITDRQNCPYDSIKRSTTVRILILKRPELYIFNIILCCIIISKLTLIISSLRVSFKTLIQLNSNTYIYLISKEIQAFTSNP